MFCSSNHIFARSFFNIKHDNRFSKFSSIRCFVFIFKSHFGNISKINGIVIFCLYNKSFKLFRVFNLTNNSNSSALPTRNEISCRHGHVFSANGINNIIKTYLCGHHFVNVYSNFNFFFLSPSYINLFNFLKAFNFIFKIFTILFKLIYGVVTRNIDI